MTDENIRVEVVCERLQDVAEVRRRLADLAAHDGWVCTTSGISWRNGQDTGLVRDAAGYPLSAEIVVSQNESVQLRQSDSGWMWTRLVEKHVEDSGEADRARETQLMCTEGALSMTYRCYWRRTAMEDGDFVRPFAPYAARFTGFKASAES